MLPKDAGIPMAEAACFNIGKSIEIEEELTPEKITKYSKNFQIILQGNCLIYGSSGSGKTVLCKVLIEEAALAGFPCLVIDPKGDLAQLAWPPEIMNSVLDERGISYYKSCHERLGTLSRSQGYLEKVKVELQDHNFIPNSAIFSKIFSIASDNRVPITIVSLHFASNEEKKAETVKRILVGLLNWNDAPENVRSTKKFLFIDEAHRFSKQIRPEIYELLNTLVREKSRQLNLIIVLSTQSQEDFGPEFISGGNFRHFFNFEKEQNYTCTVLERAKAEVFLRVRTYLIPRYTFSLHRKEPITCEEFDKAIKYWDVQCHPITRLRPPVDGTLTVNKLDDLDFEIVSFLNSTPLKVNSEIEWNPSAVRKILPTKINNIEKILASLASNAFLKSCAHYHIWLDYAKIGYPITAFFITRGKEGWEQFIHEIRNLPEVIEIFEIKAHKEQDVNLLFKLRFQNMDHYYHFVKNNLLKISIRGKTTEERYKEFLQKYKEESKRNPEYVPEIPPERVVSGCICNKIFVEHPACYIHSGVIENLSEEETITLRYLTEIEDKGIFFDEENCHHVNLNVLSDEFLDSVSYKNITEDEIIQRIRKMVEWGIIKGVFYEMPWNFWYKTAFVIAQFDFMKEIETQLHHAIKHHNVQEVYAIVGTYDTLIKIRIPKKESLPEVSQIISSFGLLNPIPMEVVREIKTGYNINDRRGA